MGINEKLNKIQAELKAPKSQFNKFGNYYYRSAEDILNALKPLLKETKTTITLNDEIIAINERVYVKATATLTDENNESISTTAFAREEESKKGMDASQLTGSCSTYARKYALNGLFAIDDTKDADVPVEEEKPKQENKLNFYSLPQGAIDTLVNGAKAKKHVLTQDDVDKYIYKLAEKEKEKYANQ